MEESVQYKKAEKKVQKRGVGLIAQGNVGGEKAMCSELKDRPLGISWLSGKVKMWDHFWEW